MFYGEGRSDSAHYDMEEPCGVPAIPGSSERFSPTRPFTVHGRIGPSGRVSMNRAVIRAPEIPSSPAFSHAIRVGNLLFLSGMAAFDPGTKKVDALGIEAQTDRAIRNCEIVLRLANTRLANVVQVTVLLREPSDFDGMNRVYLQHFPENPPARAVAKLGV